MLRARPSRFSLLIVFFLIALLVWALFWYWAKPSLLPAAEDGYSVRTDYFLGQLTPEHLQDGNIIFVHKPGIWGNISQAFSPNDQRYSHVGILSFNAGHPTVIHADGDPMDPQGQVREETLTSFIQLANAVGIYSFTFSKAQKYQMVLRAKNYVEKAYKFNSEFIMGKPNAFYCTELIWTLAKEASGIDVVPHKRQQWQQAYVGLDDLTINPYLKEMLAIRYELPKN